MIATQAWLFFGGAALFLRLLRRQRLARRRGWSLRTPAPRPGRRRGGSAAAAVPAGADRGPLFLAVIFGTIAASQWDVVLLYLNRESFGVEDPQFGRDVGFYVFTLPALRFIYGWLIGVGDPDHAGRRRASTCSATSSSASTDDGDAPDAGCTWRCCCCRGRGAVHLGATGWTASSSTSRPRRRLRRHLHRHPRAPAVHLRRHGAGGADGAGAAGLDLPARHHAADRRDGRSGRSSWSLGGGVYPATRAALHRAAERAGEGAPVHRAQHRR